MKASNWILSGQTAAAVSRSHSGPRKGSRCLLMVLAAWSLTLAANVLADEAQLWEEVQKLVASERAADELFGLSVALEGETALVGAPWADVDGNSRQGAVWVFTRDGNDWIQQQKLVAENGAADDEFGWSLALDGDTILVGSQEATVDGNLLQGAAWIFTQDGDHWVEHGKLVAEDGEGWDLFGQSVALRDGIALVGAPGVDNGSNRVQGAVYEFVRSGNQWMPQPRLLASDGGEFDNFGFSVAFDGTTAVVGALGATVGGNSLQGAAWVFTRIDEGWVQQEKLTASDGDAFDNLGASVALDGETVLVGAPSASVDGKSEQGAVYVYIRDNGDWIQQEKLVASEGAEFDLFGVSVALDGETVLVGALRDELDGNAFQGKAWVFTRDDDGWIQQDKLSASDGTVFDYFGRAVALDGQTALVGALWAEVDGISNQGAAYLFRLSGERAGSGLACSGADTGLFQPPLDSEVLIRRPNRVLPLRMQLFDDEGFEITDQDLQGAPVVQVVFLGEFSEGDEVPDELNSAGRGDDGNTFSYGNDYWQFNLSTRGFSAPGQYAITVEAGDSSYTIDPSCTTTFAIQ